MENSKEVKKLDEKELEKMTGGLWRSSTLEWFLRNNDEIMQRADRKCKSGFVYGVIMEVSDDKKMWSINDLKNALRTYVNVDDLN